MSTASTLAALQTVRTHLLTYAPAGGSTLAVLLGTSPGAGSDGRLYIDQPPEDVTYPYGLLRLMDERAEGDDGSFARRWLLEIQLFTRPRGLSATVKAMADQCERALRAWSSLTGGVIVAQRGIIRNTLLYEAPADRDLVQERILVPLYVHPAYLTQDSS